MIAKFFLIASYTSGVPRVESLRWSRLHPLVRLAVILHRDADEIGRHQDNHLVHDSFYHNQRGNSSSLANRLEPLRVLFPGRRPPSPRAEHEPEWGWLFDYPKVQEYMLS
jgi:hypothetical protein